MTVEQLIKKSEEQLVKQFALADEKPVAVYAYCNLHGLWKADI
jgi:superoxide reductase